MLKVQEWCLLVGMFDTQEACQRDLLDPVTNRSYKLPCLVQKLYHFLQKKQTAQKYSSCVQSFSELLSAQVPGIGSAGQHGLSFGIH